MEGDVLLGVFDALCFEVFDSSAYLSLLSGLDIATFKPLWIRRHIG